MCCNSDLYPIFQTCCRVYQYLSRFCVNSFTWRNPVIVDHEAWNLACIGKIFSLSYQINFFFLSQLWKFSFKVLRLVGFFFYIEKSIKWFQGFSAGLYAFFRDQFGNPLTPRDPDSNKPRNIHPMWAKNVSTCTLYRVIQTQCHFHPITLIKDLTPV